MSLLMDFSRRWESGRIYMDNVPGTQERVRTALLLLLGQPSSARGTGTALTTTLNEEFALLSSAPHLNVPSAQDMSGKCSEVGVMNTTNEWRLEKDISLPVLALRAFPSPSCLQGAL